VFYFTPTVVTCEIKHWNNFKIITSAEKVLKLFQNYFQRHWTRLKLFTSCRSLWNNSEIILILRPGRGAEYCDQLVCLSVYLSVREHISGTAGTTKCFVQIPCGRGSVVLWRRCDTLCTSGFMDDVTFGRSRLYVEAWTTTTYVWRCDTGTESDVCECLVSHVTTA